MKRYHLLVRTWTAETKQRSYRLVIQPTVMPEVNSSPISHSPSSSKAKESGERSDFPPNTWTSIQYQMKDFLKYQTLDQLAQMEAAVIHVHPNFSMQASLTSLTLRMPKPPSDFGRQMCSQQTKFCLVFKSANDHKKFLRILSIYKHTFLWRESGKRNVKTHTC